MDDKELLRLLSRDGERGLQAALELYGGAVKTVIDRVLYRFPQDAEECTADVFLKLWKHRRKLGSAPVRAWLIVTARSTAIDRYRKLNRDEPIPLPDMKDDTMLLSEEKIGTLIDSMLPPDREIFIRKYYFLETAAEIAATTGRSVDDINTRLSRGRKKLREQILKGGKQRYA